MDTILKMIMILVSIFFSTQTFSISSYSERSSNTTLSWNQTVLYPSNYPTNLDVQVVSDEEDYDTYYPYEDFLWIPVYPYFYPATGFFISGLAATLIWNNAWFGNWNYWGNYWGGGNYYFNHPIFHPYRYNLNRSYRNLLLENKYRNVKPLQTKSLQPLKTKKIQNIKNKNIEPRHLEQKRHIQKTVQPRIHKGTHIQHIHHIQHAPHFHGGRGRRR